MPLGAPERGDHFLSVPLFFEAKIFQPALKFLVSQKNLASRLKLFLHSSFGRGLVFRPVPAAADDRRCERRSLQVTVSAARRAARNGRRARQAERLTQKCSHAAGFTSRSRQGCRTSTIISNRDHLCLSLSFGLYLVTRVYSL